MAARSLVIILLTTLLAPMVHAEADNTLNLGFGATLSDNPDDAPLTYAFSPAVRAAFARTSDLSQYTIDQRESVEQWVVVSPFDIGTPTTELANSYIVDANFADGASNFAILQYEGKIEVAYPLVEKTVAKKWTGHKLGY